MNDPFACAEIGCHYLEAGDLDTCEKERHCPFAHQRRREEKQAARDRADAEAKDAKAKEDEINAQ
jgi:hypothetical protein